MVRLVPLIKVLIAFFWVFVLLFVMVGSLPENPLSPSSKNRLILKSLLPERWGFFTKSPRDYEIFIYSKNGDNWESIMLTPNSSYKNFFGINRRARAQGSESGILIYSLQKDSLNWIESKNITHQEFLKTNQSAPFISIENAVKKKTICGDVWVILQKPVPWAWSSHLKEVNMPMKAIHLNIICKW